MKLTISREDLNAVDINSRKYVVSWTNSVQYFDKQAGDEFYRMLAFLSKSMPEDTTLVDIGTYHGLSTAALSVNDKCTVFSYDIYDHISESSDVKASIKSLDNVQYKIKDCLDDEAILASARLIVLDIDPHDGLQEVEILNKLRSIGYKGVVILDDIKLNDKMKTFWNDIPERKVDVTPFGHWSGTGIVYFSDEYDFNFQ